MLRAFTVNCIHLQKCRPMYCIYTSLVGKNIFLTFYLVNVVSKQWCFEVIRPTSLSKALLKWPVEAYTLYFPYWFSVIAEQKLLKCVKDFLTVTKPTVNVYAATSMGHNRGVFFAIFAKVVCAHIWNDVAISPGASIHRTPRGRQ